MSYDPTANAQLSSTFFNLQNGMGGGINQFTIMAIVYIINTTASLLTDTFDFSLKYRISPKEMQEVKLLAIPKAGDVKSIVKYKPILMLLNVF